MASNGSVIEYHGARGTTYRIKFRDATGRQVMETLKARPKGWTRQQAERALGARLAEVEQTRWKKPEKLLFEAFAQRFEDEVLPGRGLKPCTLIDYKATLRNHLVPALRELELASIEAADLDRYIASKTGKLSAKTIANHLTLLHSMFKVAKRWKLVNHNPVEDVDAPRGDEAEMSILTEAEVARLLTAYQQLEADPAEGTTAPEWRQVRRIVTLALGTGLRRGELLALRWQDAQMLEGTLSVREAFVRGAFQAPKSRRSRRTFEVGPVVAEALNEQWKDTRYRADTDLVFCHRELGTPLDPSKLSRTFMRPALTKAAITKPFRTWHDLRHTAITMSAAAGNPQAYMQMQAGHSQGAITERYIHAAAVMFPGAAAKTEERLFGATQQEEAAA